LRGNPPTIDRRLLWADATFYAACSSFLTCVALINTLPRAAKWLGPNVLERVPLMAALHHSGYRTLYYVATSFLVNVPSHVLSALVGTLVFLIAQRPRSLAYSTLIMAPQILLFMVSALDGHRLTWLWMTTELAWVIMAIGTFHTLSLAASHVAVMGLGREVQPRAPVVRLIGVILAIGPAFYLALAAHRYLWSGFTPAMRILVPLAALTLLLFLAIRYSSRPSLTAAITAAGFLMLMFGSLWTV
jgi:hypothetical protein